MHDAKNIGNFKSDFYRRLAFDEILASFLISSEIRKKIKKIKKKSKIINKIHYLNIMNKLDFKLTNDQKKTLNEINNDLTSKNKMFRLLQGDVGSGKTIVALISALNVINSGYQVAFMAPTEILARQHYNLAKNLFPDKINLEIISSKTEYLLKKDIHKKISNHKIDMIFGTHSLFQKKINFSNLGYIIIDEQHKFGVRQRKKLSDKGGKNCDILVMSATPIPRTMIMTVFGDMDTSIIKNKPKNRKEIKTYSKLESKINDVIKFVKKEIDLENQVFWVCPLIKESKKVDHQSSIKRYEDLKKIFKDKVGLLHGALDKEEKNNILQKFLNKKIDILVSTTVIEVGIDFPNANLIIIENSNKFGLSQLHQLRGRVGRGDKQSTCILLYKKNLSQNARKRIRILKSSNDGFFIAEEDLKLRGFGDILGFQQSGIKDFLLADPLKHEELFKIAEENIKIIENNKNDFFKYESLLKLFDRADIINYIKKD